MLRLLRRESTRTTTEAEAIRAEISDLCARHARGDLTERAFARAVEEKSLDLARALGRTRMDADESILAEHHVVMARTRLSRTVFGAQEEEAISLFATERRLVQVQMLSMTGPTPASSPGDRAEVVDVSYDRIHRLVRRRAVRLGEAGMGAAIVSGGLLFRDVLQITAPFFILVGVAGIVHGLLLPTRWIEVWPADPSSRPTLRVHAPGRRTGRRLVRLLRSRISPLAM